MFVQVQELPIRSVSDTCVLRVDITWNYEGLCLGVSEKKTVGVYRVCQKIGEVKSQD